MPRKPTKPRSDPKKPPGRRLSLYRREYVEVIELLRTARIEAGLTQKQVAVRLGVQQTLMSKIEKRDRRLDVLELRDLCGIYGITLNDFVTRLEERLNPKST